MLISGGADSTTTFNQEGNLPWFYAEQDEKMKEILRAGLEMFIKGFKPQKAPEMSTPQQNLQPTHQTMSQSGAPQSMSQSAGPQNMSQSGTPTIGQSGAPAGPPPHLIEHTAPPQRSNQFESLTDIIERRQRESNPRNYYDSRNNHSGPGADYWPNSNYNSPYIRDDERQSAPSGSMWPEAPDFNGDDFFEASDWRPQSPARKSGYPITHSPLDQEINRATSAPGPIGPGFSGSRVSAIGAELKRTNGSSPFDDRGSEDSDSRWEPSTLWKGSLPAYTLNQFSNF